VRDWIRDDPSRPAGNPQPLQRRGITRTLRAEGPGGQARCASGAGTRADAVAGSESGELRHGDDGMLGEGACLAWKALGAGAPARSDRLGTAVKWRMGPHNSAATIARSDRDPSRPSRAGATRIQRPGPLLIATSAPGGRRTRAHDIPTASERTDRTRNTHLSRARTTTRSCTAALLQIPHILLIFLQKRYHVLRSAFLRRGLSARLFLLLDNLIAGVLCPVLAVFSVCHPPFRTHQLRTSFTTSPRHLRGSSESFEEEVA